MNTQVAKTGNDWVSEFAALVRAGIEAWKKAADLYVARLDADPQACEKIMEKYPQITAGFLRNFERIGRGQMLPELMDIVGRGAQAMRRLPVSEQRKYYDEPADMVIIKDGKTDTIKVDLKACSDNNIVRQLVAGDHVRTVAEQRQWLASRANIKEAESAGDKPRPVLWDIKANKLIVRVPCMLSKPELLHILSMMG